METLANQTAYYDNRWSTFQYANLYAVERCLFFLRAIRDLELEEPRICDLGCGTGWLTEILNALGPALGIELSPKAVELAKQQYSRAQFVCADATLWESEPESFDVVVSQEVIEHIENKGAYLNVIRRALRAGGYLLMTTPNLDVLNAIPTEERKSIWEIQPVELPLNRRELDELLNRCGFEVLKTGSVVVGRGRLGLQRLLNSHKLECMLSRFDLGKAWTRYRGWAGFGMYLTTLAKKIPLASQTG